MNMMDKAEQAPLATDRMAEEVISHRELEGDVSVGLLLVCDHARNAIPAHYDNLGLPAGELERHIAYDIGAEAVVTGLAARLGLPAVLSGFSRLLIDPNRGLDDPTLVMQISDGTIIPGNIGLTAAERDARLNRYYLPYHRAIDQAIDRSLASGYRPALLSVHSFTPAWRGMLRPWHAGFLWEDDVRFTDLFMASLAREPGYVIGNNEPYSGGLKGDCMNVHAVERGLPHTLVEIRQDLIADDAGVEAWVDLLARHLGEMIGAGEIAALHDAGHGDLR